jgi:hypothetical protein
MAGPRDGHLWALAHAERAALADDLAGLGAEQWRHNTLCAPSPHTPAYLGEVVVHAQDIRQPLGLVRTPGVDALTPVADFFARRDFTVRSRTLVAGLELRADDGPFAAGTGPLVTGSTLALVMAMAGRVPYVAGLDGPGVPALRSRLHAKAGESAR